MEFLILILLILCISNIHLAFLDFFDLIYVKNHVTIDIQYLLKYSNIPRLKSLTSIVIQDSSKLYALQNGFIKPHIIVSADLYNSFNHSELCYIVLHEYAHWFYRHSFRAMISQIVLILIGITILAMFPGINVMVVLLIGLILGIINIQVMRLSEYQADQYALNHLKNINSYISATKKLEKYYKNLSKINFIIRFLFFRGIPFKNRYKLAQSFKK